MNSRRVERITDVVSSCFYASALSALCAHFCLVHNPTNALSTSLHLLLLRRLHFKNLAPAPWQVFSGDARYLRGYVRAAGPADGACKVVCTAGDAPCSLECAQATDELTQLPQYDANGAGLAHSHPLAGPARYQSDRLTRPRGFVCRASKKRMVMHGVVVM